MLPDKELPIPSIVTGWKFKFIDQSSPRQGGTKTGVSTGHFSPAAAMTRFSQKREIRSSIATSVFVLQSPTFILEVAKD